MAVSYVVYDMKRDIGRKRHFFIFLPSNLLGNLEPFEFFSKITETAESTSQQTVQNIVVYEQGALCCLFWSPDIVLLPHTHSKAITPYLFGTSKSIDPLHERKKIAKSVKVVQGHSKLRRSESSDQLSNIGLNDVSTLYTANDIQRRILV